MDAIAQVAASGGFGAGLLLTAFGFGFRHGIDWDHIAAITDITSTQPSRRRGIRLSSLYAVGHAVVVFAIGLLAIVAGERLPAGTDALMGRVVGMTLVVLGGYVLYALVRDGRDFRLRSRWMLVFAGVRGAGQWVGERLGRPASAPVRDPFADYGGGTSVAVGMVHGVGAETPTQILVFVAAAGAGGAVSGVAVLTTFLLGLFGANLLVAVASASGYLAATNRFPVYAAVSVLIGVVSLAVGAAFLLGQDSMLPALFAG